MKALKEMVFDFEENAFTAFLMISDLPSKVLSRIKRVIRNSKFLWDLFIDHNPGYLMVDRQETSLCLWEAFVIDQKGYPEISGLKTAQGVAVLRYQFTDSKIADACNKGFEIASEAGYDYAFDIDFCPTFLYWCISVNANNDGLCLVEGWQDKCLDIATEK